jgi:hypothetical protein
MHLGHELPVFFLYLFKLNDCYFLLLQCRGNFSLGAEETKGGGKSRYKVLSYREYRAVSGVFRTSQNSQSRIYVV